MPSGDSASPTPPDVPDDAEISPGGDITAVEPAELERHREQYRQLSHRLASLRTQYSENPAGLASRLPEIEAELAPLRDAVGFDPDDPEPADFALSNAVREWSRLCGQFGLSEAAAATSKLSQDLIEQETAAWQDANRQLLAEPNAEDCFAHLMHTTTLALDAMVHGGRPGLDERLEQVRDKTRQALVRYLDQQPATVEQRDRWETELIDRSEVVLTSIDDLAPELAARQLTMAADDVRWHLDHIEAQRGTRRWHLWRKYRRLTAEAQERQLQARLETRYGRQNVGRFERLILLLICFVLTLLVVEAAVDLSERSLLLLHLADAAACAVFLWEFGVKWYYAPARGRWFWRHVLIDLIPSIPFGLLLWGIEPLTASDAVRTGRLARFLRLPRLGRYVRILRPAIRLLRAFGFLARGLDRLARRYGSLVNRNIILYPNRAERQRARSGSQGLAWQVRRLQGHVHSLWKQTLRAAPEEQRPRIAQARLDVLQCWHANQPPACPTPRRLRAGALREMPAEMMLRRLSAMTPSDIESSLDARLTERMARIIRIFSRPPTRWLPVIGACVPRLDPAMSDSQVVAAAARRFSANLKRYHDAWFWLADLHGTVSPSEFVDRLGTMLVKSSFRPAYRLVLFGGVYLLVVLVVRLAPFDFLNTVETILKRFVGSALLLLGGICFVVLGFGWWLKRLAREATEFYEQAAAAQFLALTEIIRGRHLARDAEILYRRVLEPEWELHDAATELNRQRRVETFVERVQQSLLGNFSNQGGSAAFDMLERTVLLYRDSLDGALFVDSDNRTTCQLLGNPALRQFLTLSKRISRRRERALRALDLERQKSFLGGPYLWFTFIARSTAHSVACLIVDYNRNAVPLAELPLASPSHRQRYETWLAAGPSASGPEMDEESAEADEASYVTTAFTALHFLDFDLQRDQEVEQYFGPQVLERLRRDRFLLVRRVFGTYPWQNQPKDQRVLNLYALYERWLSGGRALLLPLSLLWVMLRTAARLAGWVGRAIGEIRRPDLRVDRTSWVDPDFATAIRKVQRMRGPVVYAAMELRAIIDAEYLGVPLPGTASHGDTAPAAESDLDADLRFMDAEPPLVEQMENLRARAEADMQRLGQLIDEGLLQRAAGHLSLPDDALRTPIHRRAAAAVYLADYGGVRRHLSARQIVDEVCERAIVERPEPPSRTPHPKLSRLFRRYWRRHGTDCDEDRRSCWWAVVHNHWGAAGALVTWHKLRDDSLAEGERILADLLRHPGRIIEQLVTLRTVQTLGMLDVLIYRQHIFELGQYGEASEFPPELLNWPD